MNAPINMVALREMASTSDTPAFINEARSFFCGDTLERDWTDQQRSAVLIVNTLAAAFLKGQPGAPTLPPEIVKCAHALMVPTMTKRRIGAMQAIEAAARQIRFNSRRLSAIDPGLVDTSNERAAKTLVQQLDSLSFELDAPDLEQDFTVLLDELPDLIAKLKLCDPKPKGKSGAKGVPRVLAEIIVEANGGLGFKLDADVDDETLIDSVRKQLDSDWQARNGDPKSQRVAIKGAHKKSRKQRKIR